MEITQRQEKILDSLIRDYISLAQPISSELLGKKHKFGLSPATLRIEMQKLTDGGFLCQPHTSAGRVPTDRGYRFFVDKTIDDGLENWQEELQANLQNIQKITRLLAEESGDLALGYLPEDKMLWKDGWTEVFHEPEFSEAGSAAKFTEILDDFEKNIESTLSPGIKIFIGKENPFSRINDFSIISTGVFAILGPKRMDYNKNINLLKSATKWRKKNQKK